MIKRTITLSIFFLVLIRIYSQNIFEINPTAKSSGKIHALSEVSGDVSYVPLQTNEGSLIGSIMAMKLVGDRYYLKTAENILFCFGKDGSFEYKLDKKGRGPEEFLYISDFDVSHDNRNIAILSGNDLIFYSVYDHSCSFIKKLTLKPRPNKINYTGSDHNILLQYSNEDGSKPYSYLLINSNGDTLYKRANFFPYTIKDGWIAYSKYETLNYWFGNKLFTKELQNDTLFVNEGENKLMPYLIFKSCGKNITPQARADGKNFSENMTKYFQIQQVYESGRYIWFYFCFEDIYKDLIYDKLNKKNYIVEGGNGLIDDLAGGVNFKPFYCRNGFFYSWVSPNDLIDHFQKNSIHSTKVKSSRRFEELQKKVNNLKITDNPVLITVRFK